MDESGITYALFVVVPVLSLLTLFIALKILSRRSGYRRRTTTTQTTNRSTRPSIPLLIWLIPALCCAVMALVTGKEGKE